MTLSDYTSTFELTSTLDSGPAPLRPYDAFAIGAGKDEEGPFLALALVHADGDRANENIELLHGRIVEGTSFNHGIHWSDIIDGAEISAEGVLLLAKLRGNLWLLDPFGWPHRPDNLIGYAHPN